MVSLFVWLPTLENTWLIWLNPWLIYEFVKIYIPYSSLNNWGRVVHICSSKLTIIGSDNGLSPGQCQAIIWTNAEMLLIAPLGTIYSDIWMIDLNEPRVSLQIYECICHIHMPCICTSWSASLLCILGMWNWSLCLEIPQHHHVSVDNKIRHFP